MQYLYARKGLVKFQLFWRITSFDTIHRINTQFFMKQLKICKSQTTKSDILIFLSHIDDYLIHKVNNHKFKLLKIYRREFNCGVSNPNSNGKLLANEVSKDHDSYIFTEDDNVFSPNFLLFVNQGLEKYKNDAKCLAVCGYNYYGVKIPTPKNNYLSKEY